MGMPKLRWAALMLAALCSASWSIQVLAASPAAPLATGEASMMKSATLKVSGATLYYETWGSGPLLLVIPGGPQDAGVFAALAGELADRYTVVPYDPRGNSRSAFQGEPAELSLDQQADDAAALIRHLGGRAHVFGTSGGAQIGLNLAARYPLLVETLVVHEPPTMMLLDDPSAEIAETNGLYDIYKTQGVDAAMGAFFGANALEGGSEGDAPADFDMPPEAAETMGRVMGNFDYWLAHGMRPLSFYTPDVAALKSGAPRIVVGISAQSEGLPIARMSGALAETLGLAPIAFPGDHISGFDGPNAAEFAAVLDTAIGG
jgi:pimeloyl-ACP methyl ester carboxylesterase